MLNKYMNKWYPTERLIEHSEKQVEIKLQKKVGKQNENIETTSD